MCPHLLQRPAAGSLAFCPPSAVGGWSGRPSTRCPICRTVNSRISASSVGSFAMSRAGLSRTVERAPHVLAGSWSARTPDGRALPRRASRNPAQTVPQRLIQVVAWASSVWSSVRYYLHRSGSRCLEPLWSLSQFKCPEVRSSRFLGFAGAPWRGASIRPKCTARGGRQGP